MKRIKTSLCLLMAVLLLTTWLIMVDGKDARAADDVELVGKSSGLVVLPEGGKLFDLGRLNPGDVISRTLKIRNDYSEPFTLYMRAERIGEKPEGPDLLEQLKLTIIYKGKAIYQGPVSGKGGKTGDITSNISLGEFTPRESRDLIAKIQLPGYETGNEFQGLTAEVKWVFMAQTTHDDGGGKDKDKGKNKDKKKDKKKEDEPIHVDDEPIPRGELEPTPVEPEPPEGIEVPDEESPMATPDEEVPTKTPDMPKTGEGLPYPYYALGAFALIVGIRLTVNKKL